MYGSELEIDLHGRNTYQARVTIDAALRKAPHGLYRIRLIHGYNAGTSLRDMIRDEYAGHPRIKRIAAGINPGITELILREF